MANNHDQKVIASLTVAKAKDSFSHAQNYLLPYYSKTCNHCLPFLSGPLFPDNENISVEWHLSVSSRQLTQIAVFPLPARQTSRAARWLMSHPSKKSSSIRIWRRVPRAIAGGHHRVRALRNMLQD